MIKKTFFRSKMMLFLTAVFILLAAAVSYDLKTGRGVVKEAGARLSAADDARSRIEAVDAVSKVILNVRNMSCSGCISTIKGALSDFEGIKDVFVDVAGGKVEVYYNPERLKDITVVEKAITASDYPATIVETLSQQEIAKQRELAAAKSAYAIAAVSGYDISREDFNLEMDAAKLAARKKYGDQVFATPQGEALKKRLQAQVAGRLIEEGFLLSAIERAGYTLDEAAMNAEFKKYLAESGKDMDTLRRSSEAAEYDDDYFMKKIKNGLLINRYLEKEVLAGASTPDERRRLFSAWFNNTKSRSDIVYYDKVIEQAVKNQNASSSCCSAG